MENNTDSCATDTIPIPPLDIERKTVPVFCPWCYAITGVAKTDVVRFDKISPAYKACRKCMEFINQGKVFLGRSPSLSRCLFSFCRRMCP